MAFLARLRRSRTFKVIARTLPPYLISSYGRSDYYTPAQVQAAMENTGCNLDFVDHACVMFCHVDALAAELGPLREEIADMLFGGDSEFSFADFTAFRSPGSGETDAGDGLDSGGDGDGGGD